MTVTVKKKKIKLPLTFLGDRYFAPESIERVEILATMPKSCIIVTHKNRYLVDLPAHEVNLLLGGKNGED